MATIGGLVESAYSQVIADVDLSDFVLPNDTLNVYQGFSNEEKAAPCVIVSAVNVTDEAPNLGVYRVKLTITVKQMAGDSDATVSDNLTVTIFEAVTASNIKAQLMAKEPKLAVYDIIFVTSNDDTSGDAWTQSLELEIIAVQAP
jgi:hypothetical protein